MDFRRLLTALAVSSLLVASLEAAIYYENFENGSLGSAPPGWSIWFQRSNNNQTKLENENPDLGTDIPDSGANNLMAFVGGANWNGGIFRQITGLPTNQPLTIDGYFRLNGNQNGATWAEVWIAEGVQNPVQGQDYGAGAGRQLAFKDEITASGQAFWNGKMSTNANVTKNNVFQTASGTVTIVLKTGNVTGSTVIGTWFDDISIVPEPATMAFLGLGAVALTRRRTVRHQHR